MPRSLLALSNERSLFLKNKIARGYYLRFELGSDESSGNASSDRDADDQVSAAALVQQGGPHADVMGFARKHCDGVELHAAGANFVTVGGAGAPRHTLQPGALVASAAVWRGGQLCGALSRAARRQG